MNNTFSLFCYKSRDYRLLSFKIIPDIIRFIFLATTSENTPSSATPPQTNHNVADVNAKLESTSDKTCSVVAAEDPVLGVTEKSSKPSHLRV